AVQARTAQVVALASQHIRAEVIEAAEFPRLVEQYKLQASPTTIIDGGKSVLLGVQAPEELVDQIVRAAEQQLLSTKSALVTGLHDAGATATPLPQPQRQEGTVRPSGLIIPGRGT